MKGTVPYLLHLETISYRTGRSIPVSRMMQIFVEFFAFFVVESISVDDVPVVIKLNTVGTVFQLSLVEYLLNVHYTSIFGREANSVPYPYGSVICLTNWIRPYSIITRIN